MLVKEMIKKEVDKLPDDLVSEVYNFIMFLENQSEKTILAKAAQAASEPSFQTI
jgi:hypothetical protein